MVNLHRHDTRSSFLHPASSFPPASVAEESWYVTPGLPPHFVHAAAAGTPAPVPTGAPSPRFVCPPVSPRLAAPAGRIPRTVPSPCPADLPAATGVPEDASDPPPAARSLR